MIFEEWWSDPTSNAYLLRGGTQSTAQARAVWRAAQLAMRERCADETLEHSCETYPELCNCSGKIAKAITQLEPE